MSDSNTIFKTIFKKHFDALAATGIPDNVASAEALEAAWAEIQNAQSATLSSDTTPPASTTNLHSGASLEPAKRPFATLSADVPLQNTTIDNPSDEIPSNAKISTISNTQYLLARELTVEYVQELIAECTQTSVFVPTKLIRAVGSFFSDLDAMLGSFNLAKTQSDDMSITKLCIPASGNINPVELKDKMDVDSKTIETEHDEENCSISIDIECVSQVYRLLLNCGSEGVENALLHAMDSLGFQMQSTAHAHSTPCYIKLYLIVLEHPGLLDPKYSPFLSSLVQGLEKVPVGGKLLLVQWIKQHAGVDRYRRQVCILQQFLTMRILQGQIDKITKAAAKVLGFYYAARCEYPEVKDSDFYNDALNEEYMRDEGCCRQEFQLWMRDMANATRRMRSDDLNADRGWNNVSAANLRGLLGRYNELDSFVSFPFVLSPASKAKVLEIDSITQMNNRYREERREASQRGARTFLPYFVLCVRRSHIKDDSLVALVHGIARDEDLKRPLKVIFDDEEGVDAGGVRKEYFQLILSRQQFLSPTYGMFIENPESHLLWFNEFSFENQENFELIGTLLGIAIYNSVLVDLPMPSAMYKKLKGHSCSLEDLVELHPDLARGLQALLSFDGDVESVFQTSFQISYADIFGVTHDKDLKPDGSNILVTNDTRQEFIDLYINHIFNDSVEVQFNAFSRGFNKVCAGNALDLFTPTELEFLLCGNPNLDFDDLERGTRYQDGFDAASPTVKMFWDVLKEFGQDDKKKFLKFTTGSDRAPIDGLSQLGLILSRNTDEDERLPSSHTCFNHLLLPAYSSIDILRSKLRYAMDQATEGFGLR